MMALAVAPEGEQKPHRARVCADDMRRRGPLATANEEARELLLERRDLRAQSEKERA
jgi:hypothetical protein